jgi:hypothetical protein
VIVDLHRCPVCKGRPHLMAGCNVPYGDPEKRYLVCWKDGMVADHVKNGQPNWVQRIRPDRAPTPHRKKKRKKTRPDNGLNQQLVRAFHP